MAEKRKEIVIRPIGIAKINEAKGKYQIVIRKEYRLALKELDKFSHVNILWWADQSDTAEKRGVTVVDKLPPFYGKDAPLMGVFATRSEYRPNPLALTSVQLLKVNHEAGIMDLVYFDAFDGTQVLDIKPYLPMTDRILSARYPTYLQHWPNSNEAATAWWAEQMGESP